MRALCFCVTDKHRTLCADANRIAFERRKCRIATQSLTRTAPGGSTVQTTLAPTLGAEPGDVESEEPDAAIGSEPVEETCPLFTRRKSKVHMLNCSTLEVWVFLDLDAESAGRTDFPRCFWGIWAP